MGESLEIHKHDVEELYKDNVEEIENNRIKFEKYKGMVDVVKEIDSNKEKTNELEEDENEPDDYIVDDTSNETEIADFEKHVKDLAKKSISKYNEGQESLEEDVFLDLVHKLNAQQRDIFDDFVERIHSGMEEEPFYL